MSKPSVLGVIPARGGSKGIARKNLQLLGGKPLVGWTIEAALGCDALDHVIVSTDDAEIMEVCRRFGASVPFERPKELAGDHTSLFPVLRHAMQRLEEDGQAFDIVASLQPTSPLRRSADIGSCIERLNQGNYDVVLTVAKLHYHPRWALRLENGVPRPFFPGERPEFRRQDEEPAYFVNGAVFVITRSALLQTDCLSYVESVSSNLKVGAVIMNEKTSIDIDSPLDLLVADALVGQTRK